MAAQSPKSPNAPVALKQLIYTMRNLTTDKLGSVTKLVELNSFLQGVRRSPDRSKERRRSGRGVKIDKTLVNVIQPLSLSQPSPVVAILAQGPFEQ